MEESFFCLFNFVDVQQHYNYICISLVAKSECKDNSDERPDLVRNNCLLLLKGAKMRLFPGSLGNSLQIAENQKFSAADAARRRPLCGRVTSGLFAKPVGGGALAHFPTSNSCARASGIGR
jgi:hypothetical protein